MDALISSALEEICFGTPPGVSLPSLWSSLTPTPSPSIKSSLWTNLLSIPSLQFLLPGNDTQLPPNDARIQRFEDAENLNLKIVAKGQLLDSFIGLYDIPLSDDAQRCALQRIAVARANGVTQNQLAKELGIENNNFFYIVKNLECRGLIVKQPAVVKTKEAGSGGDGETKNCASVMTNMLYLYRYAKHLGVQQRFEINKDDAEEGDVAGNGDGDNVLVRDYLPAMKAVCDKLEEANDKVLVVSDVKQELGYSGTKGHRAWRNICRRLKDTCVVEGFEAKVNGKVERCLRLLKTFSPKNFGTKTLQCGDDCNKETVKFGRTFQQTEQLVELSLDQQIYDMVDAEGTEGITVMEVCGRLGLDKKRNYPRFDKMVSRFGMHRQAENHKRTQAYRVWTSGNSNSNAPNAFLSKSKFVHCQNKISNLVVGNPDLLDQSAEAFLGYNNSTSEDATGKPSDGEINNEFCHGPLKNGQANHMQLCSGNVAEFLLESSGTASNAELDLVSTEMQTNATLSEAALPTLLMSPSSGSCQTHSYLCSTTDNALREQRILERLQEEKFILRSELHKWLVSLEKEKCTTMDRKTVDRILNKLQHQGQCKCVHINVPIVTNCGRSRLTMVVLHPSIKNFPPELLGEIHDKLRSFEKQVRGHGSSKWKINEAIPVLNDVKRTQIRVGSDEKTIKVEAMRANGFVLEKMGRARLLHNFLWGHLTSSPGWDDVLSSGTHSRTYILFSLEEAVKAIPIELFLQVAGSTQKYEDMIEKCKRGLHLYDLPVQEYKSLMDTQAIGRLSTIIDVLRRLKLIRLVCDGHSEDGVKVPHATFRHAMELKPYIEEPLSVVAISNLRSFDLRPRIRHDFFLSHREAVDEYWKTLEYCYAAAPPKAALHAFPGSAVPEVFHHRSWTSVKLMSADQRAELLKRIMKDDLNKSLSYEECEKIAKDLNLTIQQVLRVYYVKHHKRVNRFLSFENPDEDCQQPKMELLSSSKKRKKSFESSSLKCGQVDSTNEQLGEQGLTNLTNTVSQLAEHDLSSSGQHDDQLTAHPEDDHLEMVEELGPDDEECHSLISQYAFSKMKPTRQSRFSWTDEADRQLLIQYVRHRAALGAKFHRTDWNSLPDLPAPPRTCARRMASLNRNTKFRKVLMRLCTMLSERYAKHLEKTQNIAPNNNDCKVLLRCSPMEGVDRMFSDSVECAEEAGFEEERWDDLNDRSIKKAFEDVLCYKRMTKLGISKRVGSAPEEWSDINMNAEEYNHVESELVSSTTLDEDIENHGLGKRKDSARRSRCHRLQQKFTSKLLNEGTSVSRHVHQSLAVSNAVELLKLVFLSTSTSPELQNLLAETLRRYSEHDLFVAFSYLREKKIMIGGSGGQPYVLSQHFLHSISKSPFPANTGKRAAKFSSWLHEREKDLMEGGTNLSADLQCGDIFQLLALVSSGELSISPCIPDEGVGEAEDFRGLKRKAEDDEFCDGVKKLKSLADSELISRREKGFPGITVSVCSATIYAVNAIELLKDEETCIRKFHWNDKSNAISGQEISCSSSHCDRMQETPNFGSVIPTAEWSNESPWEAMAGYAEYLMLKPSNPKQLSPFSPEGFRSVYSAIQKAGDQGLSMEEVSQVVGMPGENMSAHIIDVLQSFKQVLKVNAYGSVRVVDALYQSKYFLTSLTGFPQDLKPHSVTKFLEANDGHPISPPENHDVVGGGSQELIMGDRDMHKVTILNLPEEFVPLNESQNSNMHKSSLQKSVVSPGWNNEGESHKSSAGMPIFPWINGDGTLNKVVYSRLVRRVLGTVMQNPGILEDNIIQKIDVLNPQNCRRLLELMILDKHLIVRKMHQSTSSGPPALLGTLLGNGFRESKSVYQEHFFANPMSASLL